MRTPFFPGGWLQLHPNYGEKGTGPSPEKFFVFPPPVAGQTGSRGGMRRKSFGYVYKILIKIEIFIKIDDGVRSVDDPGDQPREK